VRVFPRAFHRFGEAKVSNGGLLLGSSHAIYAAAPTAATNDA